MGQHRPILSIFAWRVLMEGGYGLALFGVPPVAAALRHARSWSQPALARATALRQTRRLTVCRHRWRRQMGIAIRLSQYSADSAVVDQLQ